MKTIIENIFTATERNDFSDAIKQMLLRTLEDELENFRDSEWLFDTDFINEEFDKMFQEVLAEVRAVLKEKMLEVMMKKLEEMR